MVIDSPHQAVGSVEGQLDELRKAAAARNVLVHANEKGSKYLLDLLMKSDGVCFGLPDCTLKRPALDSKIVLDDMWFDAKISVLLIPFCFYASSSHQLMFCHFIPPGLEFQSNKKGTASTRSPSAASTSTPCPRS